MKRILAMVLLAAFAAALCAEDAAAIPVFARKYGFMCTMCHSNAPRLNDFGQRYRMNGYNLPGQEGEEQTVLETPAPIAFRVTAGYVGQDSSDVLGDGCGSDFRVAGLDVLSGGLLDVGIGYALVYLPQIARSRGVEGQEGSLEAANVIFSNLGCSWLNVRAGRFEPAMVVFSAVRKLSFAPYEIYDYSFSPATAFSETRSGLEISGWGHVPLRYAAGIVNGAENRAFDTPSDVYARAAYIIGPGEGQTAGQRIGASGYFGRSRQVDGRGKLEDYFRWSADASLNAFHLNLALNYLWARDNKALWALWNRPKNVDYSGGFAQLSFLPMEKLVGFARFDFVKTPSFVDQDITRWTAGVRFYPEDDIALHAEYSYRRVANVSDDTAGNVSAVNAMLDFAF